MAKYLDSTGLGILWNKIKQMFSGVPTKTSDLENDSDFVTTAQVDSRFGQLIGAAPADLDTLEELAEKLQDGDDIHTALIQSISEKASKEEVAENYLSKSSYTASDVLNKIKTVDGANSGLDADLLDGLDSTGFIRNKFTTSTTTTNIDVNDVWQNAVKHDYRWTNTPYNSIASLLDLSYSDDWRTQIFTIHKDKTELLVRSKHDGTTWGNWRELAFTDSNVASADKLTTKQLTNENLNNIKDANFSTYYTVGFTGSNKPSNISDNFGLIVMRTFSNNYKQIITDAVSDVSCVRYFRNSTGAWSPWTEVAFTTSNVASANRVTTKQLINENLNNILDAFCNYFGLPGNTVTNKPDNMNAFGLLSIKAGGASVVHIISDDNNTYKRRWNGTSWSSWKKMLTEDDIKVVTLTEAEYNALTTKDSNTLYCIPE